METDTTDKPNTPASGLHAPTCSASSDTPETDAQSAKCCLSMIGEFVPANFARSMERERNRLRELLDDYVSDKKQIGKDLGQPEEEKLHHRLQRRIICDLQRENRMMRMALEKVHERMQGPANNKRFMQIAGPARECLNLAKPFLPNSGVSSAPKA